MRNPERIPIILAQVKEFWEKHPDLRFTQLPYCLAVDEEWLEHADILNDSDMFYVEDEELFDLT